MYFILVQILFVFIKITQSAYTTCEESQIHFANLCFSPEPKKEFSDKLVETQQLPDGWFVELGNDALRLHISEALRGELLTFEDNFENSCMRIGVEHDLSTSDFNAVYHGYNNLTSKASCPHSKDFPGVLNCDIKAPGVTKYHENYKFYTSYTDNENIEIGILCFSNGQVGWVAYSIVRPFNDAERKIISDHITSIGFSNENTVVMYDFAKC